MFDTEEDAKQSLLDLKFKKRVFQGALVKARLKTETVVRSFYPLQNTPPVFPVLPYGNMMGGMVPGMMAPVPGPFGYMNVPMMMPLGSLNGGVMQQQQQQQQQQQMNLPIGAADYQPQPPPQHMIKTVSSVDRMDMMMPSSGQAITSSTHGQTMNGTSSSPPLSNISTTHSNNNISTNNSNNNNMISNTSSISNTNSSEEAPKPRDNRNRTQNNNIHSNTPGGAHRSSSAQGNQQAADNRRKDGGSSNRRPIGGPNGSHAPTSNSNGSHTNGSGGASKSSSYLEKAIIEINVANFPPLNGVEDLPATSPGGKEAPSSSIDPSITATTTAVVSSTETSSSSSSTQHHESRGGATVEAAVAVGEATRTVTAGR